MTLIELLYARDLDESSQLMCVPYASLKKTEVCHVQLYENNISARVYIITDDANISMASI